MHEAQANVPRAIEAGEAYLGRLCWVAALGGLLFGYDTAVISGAIGFMEEHFHMSPAMKGWAASSALLGCIVGVACAGVLNDLLGRRKTLILSALAFLVSAVGTAVPKTLTVFVIYRIVGGLGVGAASMTSPLYIAEVSPARIRGRMVSWNQFAIIFGMLVVYFVNYFIARLPDDPAWNVTTGWRWMFASEALPAALFLALLFLVPESPRWLAKQGRAQEAFKVLARVEGEERAREEIAAVEAVVEGEGGSLAALFHPGMRRILLAGVVLAVLQQVTGINVFLYYAPEIFKSIAAAGADAALLQTVVVGAVNLLFTVAAIRTVDRLGRRPLMILGASGMGLSLFALGVLACLGRIEAWVLLFILLYIACFALAVGPVTWVILSEIFPTRIRGRAMGIATICLWAANYGVSQTFPMMDASPWLLEHFHHGFPYFLYGAFCAVSVVFVWRVLPETKGKTLEELERLFGRSMERTRR